MFTGIIKNIGSVIYIKDKEQGKELCLYASTIVESVKKGDSVAINGTCLTAIEVSLEEKFIFFDLWPESIERTTLSRLEKEDKVHLELPLKKKDFLGGHCILGHIDFISQVERITFFKKTNQKKIYFFYPQEFFNLIPLRGSIAIDGISLTITDKTDTTFSVSLIPETLDQTLLNELKEKSKVNIEIDYNSRIVNSEIGNLSFKLDLIKQIRNDWRITFDNGGVIGLYTEGKAFLLTSLRKLTSELFFFLCKLSYNLGLIFDVNQEKYYAPLCVDNKENFELINKFLKNKDKALKELTKISLVTPINISLKESFIFFSVLDERGNTLQKNSWKKLCERFLIPNIVVP